MDITAIIDEVEANADGNIVPEQGDYFGDDGLLYCCKCNTPKQCRITVLGRERTPFCLCKCEAERRKREEETRARAQFLRHVEKLRRACFSDDKLQGWTFLSDDQADERTMSVAKRYVENFDKMLKSGKGLLLLGECGTGKTFAAVCVANALIDKGYPCLVTNFARITNTMSGMYEGKQEYVDALNRYALIVIDDLKAEANTEYRNEVVFNVIDSRYRAGLPMIITTNLTSRELKNSADVRQQRIYSRLFECCIPVEVKGADRRREKLKADYKALSDLLGL